MTFADWKKHTKSFRLLPEGYRAMAERVAQAAYKAGERAGRKQVEQIAAQSAELAVMVEREACAKVCDVRYIGDNNREDMEARRCAAAIRDRTAALDAMTEDAERMGMEY